jgi:DNA-binding NtrC family response regulator
VGQRIAKSSSQSGPLVARSGAMKEVQKELAELFRQFVPVLITGERGTGKTFVATKLFESSFDDESPFVVIDCRSLEGGSAPSILFGDRQFQRAPDPSS